MWLSPLLDCKVEKTPPAAGGSDYAIILFFFTLPGPELADPQCTLTMPCTLQLTGSGLAEVPYAVLVLGDDQTCGSVSHGTTDTWQNPTSGSALGVVFLGRPVAGIPSTAYTACWGARPTTEAEYRVTLGNFVMGGQSK